MNFGELDGDKFGKSLSTARTDSATAGNGVCFQWNSVKEICFTSASLAVYSFDRSVESLD